MKRKRAAKTARDPAPSAPGPAPGAPAPPPRQPHPGRRAAVGTAVALALALVVAGVLAAVGRRDPTPEFSRDVAPILDAHCAVCHRPGGGGPFSLLTYAAARRRAKEIAETTRRRTMPPWLPEPTCTNFAEARILSDRELAVLGAWAAGGAQEGDPARRPPPPEFPDGWQLGKPDVVVTLPQAFRLPADGKDVYRNFVVAIPPHARRFVQGVEFQPGNFAVVHHAFINIDLSRASRRRAELEDPPGFDGMQLPESAVMPGGQLLGWQPGKQPYLNPAGLSWELPPDADLVLQLHMHPSGKPEWVRPSVGFYLTDQAPTNAPYRIELVRFDLDIPAGSDAFVAEQSYELPVDARLLRISPHTHYLGRQLEGFARFPGGLETKLLGIPDWDFNWQGDYRYAEPVFLPKGTTLSMRFRFDNTTNNVRNPFQPPRRVRYGLQTTDEMAELWFQVLPVRREERAVLARDYLHYRRNILIEDHLARLRTAPGDADLHLKAGSALNANGRADEALEHLLAAAQLRPGDDRAYYEIGAIHLAAGRYGSARPQFEKVIELNPRDGQAHGSLGIIAAAEGKPGEARAHFAEALRLNPDDALARDYLEKLAAAGR